MEIFLRCDPSPGVALRSRRFNIGRHQHQTKRKGFGTLPLELLLHLMKHTSPDDLPNLVRTNRATYSVWTSSRRAVFSGIPEAQFPEFHAYFGKLPGCACGFICSQDRRPDEQKQALLDAFYHVSVEDVESPGMESWRSFQILTRGKKPYLDWLLGLSMELDKDVALLRTIPGGANIDPNLARHALFLLWRMRWKRINMSDHLLNATWISTRLNWTERKSIVHQQTAAVKQTFSEIMQLLVVQNIDAFLEATKIIHFIGDTATSVAALKDLLLDPETKVWIIELLKKELMTKAVRIGIAATIGVYQGSAHYIPVKVLQKALHDSAQEHKDISHAGFGHRRAMMIDKEAFQNYIGLDSEKESRVGKEISPADAKEASAASS